MQVFNYEDLSNEVSKSLTRMDLNYRDNGLPIIEKYLCNFKNESILAAFKIVKYISSLNMSKVEEDFQLSHGYIQNYLIFMISFMI